MKRSNESPKEDAGVFMQALARLRGANGKRYKGNMRAVRIVLVMLALMCLCLPVMFEASAMIGQVGPDAPIPKKKPPIGKKPARAGPPIDITSAANWVQIPAGEFLMGSENGGENEKPVHRVRISRPFEMGKYEVTQAQWKGVMGNNPSDFKGANLPVENVSWEDAQQFINKLNSKNDDYVYRLPTEAEWEYACRAGSTADYAGDLNAMAWYEKNSGEKTHPVGQKQPNAWGLYDMHGNVWEWCQDWYDGDYYAQSPSVDPRGPEVPGTDPPYRVLRGGSWNNDAANCQSALRAFLSPIRRGYIIGFRLVRTPR